MSDIKDMVRISGDISILDQINANIAGTETITATIFLPASTGGEEYGGPYEVTPKASTATVLETEGLLMVDDVTVLKIPYYETSNVFGKTVYIASEV